MKMKTFRLEGSKTVSITSSIGAVSVEEACFRFRKDHGIYPSHVDEREVDGMCEVCSKVYFVGENELSPDREYIEDEDGVKWCKDSDACQTRSA
jgi:hypothetical protein